MFMSGVWVMSALGRRCLGKIKAESLASHDRREGSWIAVMFVDKCCYLRDRSILSERQHETTKSVCFNF